ncbi:MAG: hypothetical protein RSB47_00220 [Ruthenibacterium sp.]
MRLTRAIDQIIENAGLTVKDTGHGYVLGCKTEPKSFFENNPLHILALYSAAASLNATVAWPVYEAANTAAPRIAALPAKQVCDTIQAILLSEHPEALAPLVTAGGFVKFGIKGAAPCLHPLANLPATVATRWWGFLHFCKADIARVGEKLNFPEKRTKLLCAYETVFSSPIPQTPYALKKLLSGLPLFDFSVAAATFTQLNPAWQQSIALYAQLLASKEPYHTAQLAITAAELRAEHIYTIRTNWLFAQLLETVLKEPKLNTYPVLIELARTLNSCR